jgi:hypothetical protein
VLLPHKKQTYIGLLHIEIRKVKQQNHKPNMCMAAAYYQLKKGPAVVATALKDQLVHLKMTN